MLNDLSCVPIYGKRRELWTDTIQTALFDFGQRVHRFRVDNWYVRWFLCSQFIYHNWCDTEGSPEIRSEMKRRDNEQSDYSSFIAETDSHTFATQQLLGIFIGGLDRGTESSPL